MHRPGRLPSRVAVGLALLALITTTFPAGAAAAPPDDKVKVIVTYGRHPVRADERAIERLAGKVKQRFKIIDAIAAEVPRGQLKRLAQQPGVATVDLDAKVSMFDHGSPTGDFEYENAWGVEHIGSRTVHQAGIDGGGVKVAIIDTGIDYIHDDPDDTPYVVDPEFTSNYAGGFDFFNNDADPFDDNGHGTHVAGILAAEHNGYLVTGVAPGVQLFALKILNANGEGEYSGLIAALQWIVDYNSENADDIRVVNMSLGAHEPSAALQAAIQAIAETGVLLAAASGNVNPLVWQELFYGCPVAYPAAYPEVLSTTFTDGNDALTGYSCTGSEVDVAAPGDQIASTVPVGNCMFCSDTGYSFQSGTSMASPHLAGTLALLLDAGLTDAGTPGLLDDARAAICSTADTAFGVLQTPIPPSDPRYPKYFGCGVINADGAVLGIAPPLPNQPPIATDDSATVAEDIGDSISVLANDSDPDADPLTVVSVGTPAHGTATVAADGSVTYIPAPNYFGPDSFDYVVGDGAGGTDTGSVAITVTAVNDPPVANDDSASTPYQTSVTVAVLANDTDVDGGALSVTGVGPASHGTVSIAPGGTVSYSPAAGYSGPDGFNYNVSDGAGGSDVGAVSITVGVAPPPPPSFHVGDLDRSTTKTGKTWTARVTVGIHTSAETAVAGAVVTGAWSNGGTATCTTATNGRCQVSKTKIAAATGSVVFSVTSVTWSGGTYIPSANHDLDGDSNGTSITVTKPA